MRFLFLLFVCFYTPFIQGLRPGAVFNTGFGAKATAYATSYNAIVANPSALYWNPAGISQKKGKFYFSKLTDSRRKLNPTNQKEQHLFEEVANDIANLRNNEIILIDEKKRIVNKKTQIDETLSLSLFKPLVQLYISPSLLAFGRQHGFAGITFTTKVGTFGIGLGIGRVSDIKGFDDSGDPTRLLDYYYISEYLGYAISLFGRYRLGVSLIGFQENTGTFLYGAAITLGLQIDLFSFLRVGVTLHNLLGVMQIATEDSTQVSRLDTIIDVNLAFHSLPPNNNLLITLGLDLNLDRLRTTDSWKAKIGASYKVISPLVLLIGFSSEDYSLGIGLDFSFLEITYAVQQNYFTREFIHTVDINGLFQ